MIVRQLCVRPSRQLLALNHQSRILNRLYSTETSVDTPAPALVEGQPANLEGSLLHTPASTSVQSVAREAFLKRNEQRIKFHNLGSKVTNTYRPERIIESPPKPSDITLELLLASQTHLGHSTSRWNPQNSQYIFGIRNGIHIISLDTTAAYLRRAAKIVEEVAARGGLILFVGTRKGQKRYVVRAAELAGGYHVFERWIPGSLTNGPQILGHCETKVVNALDEELPEYKAASKNHPVLKPDLVICLNPIENNALLRECGVNSVPTIGVIDTDADPTSVTYPIPSNDDSLRAIGVIAGILGRAGQAGQQRRLDAAKQGTLNYEPSFLPDAPTDSQP